MSDNKKQLAWERLINGENPEALNLSMIAGRYDMRGVMVPKLASTDELKKYPGIQIARDVIKLENIKLKNIDFSSSNLNNLRIYNCLFENCLFNRTKCENWRMWGNVLDKCLFVNSSLKGSTLGAVEGDRRNSYKNVTFKEVNMQKISNFSASYKDCLFHDCKLNKVDFQGSTFDGCKFIGLLEEVLFYRYAFKGEAFPANQMKNIDFSESLFRYVEFRGLDMLEVVWPNDKDHLIIKDYRDTLLKVLAKLDGNMDVAIRRFVAVLKMKLKWAGMHQTTGVISHQDLIEIGGAGNLNYFLSLFER